jgi:DNA recombination protein RmuC
MLPQWRSNMIEELLWITLSTSAVAAILTVFLLIRSMGKSNDVGKEVREEFRANRDESRVTAKELREEVSRSLKDSSEALTRILETVANTQQLSLEGMAKQLRDLAESNQTALDKVRETFDLRVKNLQEGNESKLGEMRKESADGLKSTNEVLSKNLGEIGSSQKAQSEEIAKQLKELSEANGAALERIRLTFDARAKEMQESNENKLVEMRKEASDGLKTINESLSKALEGIGISQKEQLSGMTLQLKELTESNQGALDRIRTMFDSRIRELQEGNEKKLDEMRKTVDERLHDTLEKRLGESFKLVSDRLEAVHKGLGEMQTLASGVGDLKRVLTNVKARGTWAEVQLGALLEQILTQEQFDKNVCVKEGSSERVEFAIRLPGSKDEPDSHVWLPIDSKFPQEDYIRLQDAADKGDPSLVQSAIDALSRRVRGEAKEINDKYVNPPRTTDFAIMFLATEGLYSEVLRQPALVDELQRKYRVVVAGPTTIVAILNSLRMGFQTLVIEKRASEVWRVLAAVKTEFGKFGDVLDKVKKQLNTASKTIEETGVRTRAIEKTLRTVEQLPQIEAASALSLVSSIATESSDESEDVDGEIDESF